MRPTLCFCTLVLLVTAAAPLLAAEEGGSRSLLFADGDGLRALALGRAYTSATQDVSVIFWNPGALGYLSRNEFQVAYADLYGLGFGEQYAALALPSWRWGVFALGFRHFGVGGIEERDDRNQLLGDNISNSESEFTLGYGKSMSEAWSLGANFKVRHQALAGSSAKGIGVDFGFIFRPASLFGWTGAWTEPLTLGLSYQNAVEPSIRLDQDTVNDPGILRLGFSYPYSFGLGRWTQFLLDLEAPTGLSPRIHTGFEVSFSPLALRVGYETESASAGLGLYWRDFRFDYAFEDNPLEYVHRFGVGLRFGASVSQKRLAALTAEDQLLQAKLAAAFEEEQRSRIDELMNRAKAEYQAGEFDMALGSLATLRALEPNHAEAAALAAHCLRERAWDWENTGEFTAAILDYGRALAILPDDPAAQAGLQRCREESDRLAARSADLRERFAVALDAFGAGQPVEARDGFAAILEIEPNDEEAAAMLRRSQTAMDQRANLLLEQARGFIDKGLLAEARNYIDQANWFEADTNRLEAAESALAAASEKQRRADQRELKDRQRQAASAAAGAGAQGVGDSTGRAVLSSRDQAEIQDLYRRGMEAAESGRGDDALRYWELVWSSAPGYQQVDSYLKREYLMRGMEAFAAGDLEVASNLWEKALRVDPGDDKAKGYLERAREQLARTREIMSE